MRVFCESCNHPQPAGWKRGDFCVECGQVARRETRCYWCLNFTPDGKFCRRCGAGLVADELFGAARMLKDAGVDRFSIPPRLAEMDPEQVDTFTSIYQQHAGVMWRHLDDLAVIQSHLVQRHWGAKLEAELLPQLPWPDDKLEKMRMPHTVTGNSTDALRLIRETTPFPKTAMLALLALARLGDARSCKEVHRDAFYFGDKEVELEAVYTVTHWRCLYGAEPESHSAPMLPDNARQIVATLRAAPPSKQRDARLGMLGVEPAPKELLGDPDADVSFMAALGLGDGDQLSGYTQSSDALKRFASAMRLVDVKLGGSRIGDVLLSSAPEHQFRLLRHMQLSKRSFPELKRVLFQLMEEHKDPYVRGMAGDIACAGCMPDDALDILRLSHGDSRVLQSLFQKAKLPGETLRQLGASLVDSARFSADQFGMSEIAKRDRMPVDFVPKSFGRASREVRDQLLRFAEKQLNEYGDEALERFVVTVAFGEFGYEAPGEAWSVLHRWYRRSDAAARGPIAFSIPFADKFFGSFPAFLRAFVRILDLRFERGVFGGDYLAQLIRYPEDDAIRSLAAHEKEAVALERALLRLVEDHSLDVSLRGDCLRLLGRMAELPMFRDRVKALFKRTDRTELKGATMIASDALDRFEARADEMSGQDKYR